MQALAKGDRDGFYEQERGFREASQSPPFGRLAALVISGYDGDAVRDIARQLGKAAPSARDVKVWGPTPAFYALLRGQTRERLLVQAARGVDVQAYLKSLARDRKGARRHTRSSGRGPSELFLNQSRLSFRSTSVKR